MFLIQVKNNRLTVSQKEEVTSGSVNVNKVRFEFSQEWARFQKVAVFRAGSEMASVLLGDDGECMIPWELLDEYDRTLYAGVYGTLEDSIVLPTIWASLGTVREGAALGPDAHPPTPDLWEQELAQKGDVLGYTEDGALGLYAGEKLLSAVPVVGGGGGGVGGGLPAGCIVIWSGAEGEIPTGWVLCNGENNTPDLRGRFVLGAGGTHNVGAAGGSEEVTLTVAQMPKHTHTATYSNKTSAVGSCIYSTGTPSQGTSSTGIQTTGSSQPHPNMPPYYALCYIMKL